MSRRSQGNLLPFDHEIERTLTTNRRIARNTLRGISEVVDIQPNTIEFINPFAREGEENPTQNQPQNQPTMPKFSSHSVPTEENLPNGTPTPQHLTGNFIAKSAFIQLVERSQFGGMPSEDPHSHMETFCDYCDAISQTGVTQDQI